METYIALLRGVNVSGQKKIRMADFKAHLLQLGCTEVKTYIQSGNVVFKHTVTHPESLEKRISEKIYSEFGFEVKVLVIKPEELRTTIRNNPFLKPGYVERLYVTFLSEEPAEENKRKLSAYDYAPEEYVLEEKKIYFHSPHGYGNAKMNNNFFENKLKVTATTRNWKTVLKLSEMSGSILYPKKNQTK